jgi:gliding motility-associated-like protein
MKRGVTISFAILFTLSAQCQVPTLEWARKFGSQGFDVCDKILLDNAGNTITVGSFIGTVDFDPGLGVFNVTSNGENDIFILKLDPAGSLIWVKSIGGIQYDAFTTATIDNTGNIYIAGYFYPGTMDFDPGPGVFSMASDNQSNSNFLLKLDANGIFIWAKKFDNIAIVSMKTDPAGNLYAVGGFLKTADFDPGPGIYNLTEYVYTPVSSGSNYYDGFILKLDGAANFNWVRQIKGASTEVISKLELDMTGNIYVSGNIILTTDLDPGPGEYIITPIYWGQFILKLSPAGEFIWADYFPVSRTRSTLTNSSPNGLTSVKVDNAGNIYVAGMVELPIDVDPGPGITIISSASGKQDLVILKLSPAGELIWVKQLGGSPRIYGRITIDHAGNIYALGIFENTCDFDPGPNSFNLTANLRHDVFILRLDNNGNFNWAFSIKLYVPFFGQADILVDQANNIYTVGGFDGNVDFNPGPDTFNLIANNTDGFIQKLSQCHSVTYSNNNIDTTVCSPYTLNNQTYFRSGTYIQTYKNAAGCDSIFTIHLTVNPKPEPNLGPDRNICFGNPITFEPGIYNTYLWQDMSTSPTFTTNTQGTYWVTVTNGDNCSVSDTVILKNVVQPPANFLKPTDSICTNNTLTLKSLKKYPSYNWSTGSTGDTIRVRSAGIYWLEVIDNNGCSNIDTIEVAPKECPRGVNIPTAFTPNNDGKNDIFKALIYEDVKSFKLQVFDRWGQLVFETSEPSQGWDGSFKGIALTSSVFVWICRFQIEGQEPELKKGTVLLIK